jgi:[acyl-carrier-protein] S-malonyltransferase
MSDRIVYLFPGQGSQKVGMGVDLCRAYPEAQRRFDQADEILGMRLSRLCFEGPAKDLNNDVNAQLAVYTVSCILSDVLKRIGIVPDVVTGYSSGYYAAVYAAGGFDFETGLDIVKRAGEMLLEEGRRIDGRMAVIFGLPHEDVAAICSQEGDVDTAILNTSRQIIISGIVPAVDRTMQRCLASGALDAYHLPAATAYHSRFMAGASARFVNEIPLALLADPHTPIISYATLAHAPDKQTLCATMASQLVSTVRWFDLIRMLNGEDGRSFIEVGPGAVIARAVRWIDRHIKMASAERIAELERLVAIRTVKET